MKHRVLKNLKAMLLAAAALAPAASVAAGLSGIQQIDTVSVKPAGEITVSGIDGVWLNPDACENSSVVALSPQHPYYREIYASILAAHTTVKEVRFFLNGCIAVNGVFYPQVRSVVIY